jgi:hypothetical protein
MTALVITEAIIEAKILKKDLFIASLDTSTAFDLVDHDILIHSLIEEKCDLDSILMLNELNSGLQSKVV